MSSHTPATFYLDYHLDRLASTPHKPVTPVHQGIVTNPTSSLTRGFRSKPHPYDIISSTRHAEPAQNIHTIVEPLTSLSHAETVQHFKDTSIPGFASVLGKRGARWGDCIGCHQALPVGRQSKKHARASRQLYQRMKH